MKKISATSFAEFFVEQTPKFDEMIMASIRPDDGWLLNVATGTAPGCIDQNWSLFNSWCDTMESVRKASEGSAWKPSGFRRNYKVFPRDLPMGCPVEITQDRFRSVWPNTTKVWERAK